MAKYHTVNVNEEDLEWMQELAEKHDFKNVKELMMYATRRYKEQKENEEPK